MKPKTLTGHHSQKQSAGARHILRDCRRILLAKKRKADQRTNSSEGWR